MTLVICLRVNYNCQSLGKSVACNLTFPDIHSEFHLF